MQNVEVKVELRDPVAARAQCRLLGAVQESVEEQTDTYYRMHEGRLKRRQRRGIDRGDRGRLRDEWILYTRHDIAGPRVSTYETLSNEEASRRWGQIGLKEWLRVVKRREVWRWENARIHIDQVESLGWFLEIEVMVDSVNTVGACDRRLAELRARLEPCLGETIGVSYSDLISRRIVDTIG